MRRRPRYFPGRYIDGIYADKLRTVYEYQYNTLFDMAAANKFDVLLVLIGTLGTYLDNEHKAQFLKKFAGTPVITITAHIDGYPCIMLDNRTGMKEAIEHLIKVHGCKKIGMVSGPKTSDDALERLDVYKETLEENGIVYDEKRVAYGNFQNSVLTKSESLLTIIRNLMLSFLQTTRWRSQATRLWKSVEYVPVRISL